MGGVGSGNLNIKNYGFGARPREEDDEYRRRIKGVPKTITWTKEKCIGELNEILDSYKKILREAEKINLDNPGKLKQEAIRDLNTLQNRILEYMRYLYPPVQQNINVNVDMTVDAIIERLKNYKEKQIVDIKNG